MEVDVSTLNTKDALLALDSLINLKQSTSKMIYDRYDTLPHYYKGFLTQIINSK